MGTGLRLGARLLGTRVHDRGRQRNYRLGAAAKKYLSHLGGVRRRQHRFGSRDGKGRHAARRCFAALVGASEYQRGSKRLLLLCDYEMKSETTEAHYVTSFD